jgi:2-polyprenyl-3-methyl-5-hydroxy-6-metoxy-1,4-benzoquinol methylase
MVNEFLQISDRLPLYWRLAEKDATNPIGLSQLPFAFELNKEDWLVQQRVSDTLRTSLSRIYESEANIGYLQPDYAIARGYLDDFVDAIRSVWSNRIDIPRVIEIGCGGCEVLEVLKNLGWRVTGVDPSPIAAHWGKKKNIEVLQRRFYPGDYVQKFDLSISSDVLEHVEDPVSFLRGQVEVLNDRGMIVVAVPDCTLSLALGDVSIAMHQHINYFSESSLAACLEMGGLHQVRTWKSSYGGSIYASGMKCESGTSDSGNTNNAIRERRNYLDSVGLRTKVVRQRLSRIIEESDSCSFYVPLRALPFISDAAFDHHVQKIRFIDDTDHWHQKFFDGSEIPVENIWDLSDEPSSHICVMSLTFADKITEKIRAFGIRNAEIVTLGQLLA